jgi:hypothetical protein
MANEKYVIPEHNKDMVIESLNAHIAVLIEHIALAAKCETEEQVIEWQEKSAHIVQFGVPAEISHALSRQFMLLNVVVQEYAQTTQTLIRAIANDNKDERNAAIAALKALNANHNNQVIQ